MKFKNMNRARYYDPSSGRFLSEDPIGFSGGDYNLYRYVTNQPTVQSDPSGTSGISILLLPVAAFEFGYAAGTIAYETLSNDKSFSEAVALAYERSALSNLLETGNSLVLGEAAAPINALSNKETYNAALQLKINSKKRDKQINDQIEVDQTKCKK
ncbi:MAG: RHS repeat-associated core domain-containing protein [Bacteriovoracaceae bacterium]|nr:RHS repeat-associated core domain-containing protein [Bacteriovoracaceae bacterium]